MPYTDAANLSAMEDELEGRWGPLRQIEGLCFTAASGTSADLCTLGDSRNSQFVSILGTGKSPTWAPYCAAAYGAVAANYLNLDSARPLQTLKLTNMLPPARSERFSQSERNVLLYDGISTFVADSGGDCLIERAVTTYQENASGAEDPSYLDVETMATLAYIRTQVRTRISQVYPRHKLANDDTYVAAGQAVVRPKDIRSELIALFLSMEKEGKVEGISQFKADIVVERNETDLSRVDALIPPDLVGQFRIFAGQIQFRL
jgi:phage tail sheath gpL-like